MEVHGPTERDGDRPAMDSWMPLLLMMMMMTMAGVD